MKTIFIFISFFIFFTSSAIAIDEDYTIKPKDIKAIDGDTVLIKTKEVNASVRLFGIDCYETHINNHINYQKTDDITYDEIIKKGKQATIILEKILNKNKDIYLEITGMDKKYGRLVGIIYYKNSENRLININKLMEQSGFCPAYKYKPKHR